MAKKLTVLGDDQRLAYASKRLTDAGLHITGAGESIFDADYFLLPVPVTADGIRIKGTQVKLNDLMDGLTKEKTIFCGMPPENLVKYCSVRNIICFDYMQDETLTEKNAVLTARGIISEAVYQGAVLRESSSLVIGYGHCGKAIAKELEALGAHTEVMVRRSESFEAVRTDGYGAVYMFDLLSKEDKNRMNKYSYVFNTVPAPVLNPSAIRLLSENVMIFDIASKPGGTDFDYCREHDIFASLSLGIPGRHYPKEAGDIIAGVVLERINL